jgi:DNA-binding CsgD family transcriptional regulator
MAIKLSLKNPTFELKSRIQAVSNHFLDLFGFSYFQYLRCFVNGSIGLLTNDTRLFEYFQHVDDSPVVFSSFEKEHTNLHSYWFLWDEALPEMPVQLAREKFNIRNGLTLVRRYKNYYDMIAVALPQEAENPGSFYLNKLAAIEQFVNEFEKDNKDLITLMEKDPILLSKAYCDPNHKNICLANGKLNVLGKYGNTFITTQELSCLRFLVLGYSYKQIAQAINISPRTVETYLQRVRQRTGVESINKLEQMLMLSVNNTDKNSNHF